MSRNRPINQQNGPSVPDIFRRACKRFSAGFVLSELITASAIMIIVVFAIAFVIADSHRGFNSLYAQTYSDIVTDGHAAKAKFDAVIRKASVDGFSLGSNGEWIEVYYYANSESTAVDRYARFYCANGNLNIEYGQLNPKTALKNQIISGNVSDCTFKQFGNSVQMTLTLDDGTRTNTIVSSAVMHN